jgi:U3 small nucleolar RNA-associated protein 14
LIIF